MSRLMLCGRLVVGKGIATSGSCVGTTTSQRLCQYYARLSQNDNDAHRMMVGEKCLLSTSSVRSMFTERSLRIDSLDLLRQDKDRIFDSAKERYIERVRKYIEQGELQSIVKDDFINIIGLAENDQHLDLIEQIALSPAMKEHLADGPWGSVLMRLYYRMNQIDRAYKNIKDTEKFGDFFMQYSAFRTVMTLLYKNDKHEEVIELYNLACEKITLGNNTRQRQLDVLTLAACAKINTPESFSLAEQIFTKSNSLDNRHLKSRIESLFVYMAIKMNDPTKALNHLLGTRVRSNFYLPSISLKTIALVSLNRFEDVVFLLRESVQLATNAQKVMPQELADMLQEKKGEVEDESVRQEISDMLVELKDNNLLDDRSLESIIFNDIDTREGNDRSREGYGAHDRTREGHYGAPNRTREGYHGAQNRTREGYGTQDRTREGYYGAQDRTREGYYGSQDRTRNQWTSPRRNK